jgi:endonuclease/exonuclease/phosphatase family metal-dependent hydrolase
MNHSKSQGEDLLKTTEKDQSRNTLNNMCLTLSQSDYSSSEQKGSNSLVDSNGKAILKAGSLMGRALLIAEYFVNISSKNVDIQKNPEKVSELPKKIERLFPLYIATSHFESLDHSNFRICRANQLHDTLGVIFAKEKNCVILGDYNFDNLKEYNQNIL